MPREGITMTNGEEPIRLLTVRAVIERLNISRAKAYQLMRDELPVVRIGRAVRVPESGLEEWILKNTTGGKH